MGIGIIFDIITVVILGLCVFTGYKKGLVSLVYGLVAFLISILISFILYIPISNFVVNNTTLDDTLCIIIEDRMSNKEAGNTQVTQDDMNNTSKVIVNYANKYVEEAKNDGIHVMAVNISQSIVRVMVLIVLYLVSRMILVVLKGVCKALSDLPIIKQFNKLGGVVVGTLKGLIILYIVFAIISISAPLKENSKISQGINESYITSFMYNNNIILMLLLK